MTKMHVHSSTKGWIFANAFLAAIDAALTGSESKPRLAASLTDVHLDRNAVLTHLVPFYSVPIAPDREAVTLEGKTYRVYDLGSRAAFIGDLVFSGTHS